MRWAFLLIGFGAGLAVGLLVGESEPGRAARRGPAPVRVVSDPPPRAPPEPLEKGSVPPPDAVEAVQPVEAVERPDELNEGYGWLVVDFEGFDGLPQAWVTRFDMSGNRDDYGLEQDGDEIPEGVYDVWWMRGPRRLGARVRIAAGRTTRVRAVDYSAARLPRDLGVLGLRIHASWGGPMAGAVCELDRHDEGVGGGVNQRGCLSRAVWPGRYTVTVGDLRVPVTISAGRETILEVQHQGQGDLLFDPPSLEGTARLRVRRKGERSTLDLRRYAARTNGVMRVGFVYLQAGEYDVFNQYGTGEGGGTRLGTVTIHPGRCSTFRVVHPPGGIAVVVECPFHVAKRMRVRVSRADGYWDELILRLDEGDTFRGSIESLHPGIYRVSYRGVAETVAVGDSLARVALRLP